MRTQKNQLVNNDTTADQSQESKPSNLIQSIERVSPALEVLGQSPQKKSVKILPERVNLSKGTAHRLLSSLAYCDYVRQD